MIHIKEQTIGLNQYSELVAHFGLISEALSIFPGLNKGCFPIA